MERKITLTRTLMFAFTLLLGYSTYAQDRTCLTDEYMQEALKNPVYAAQYKENQKKFKAELDRRANGDFSQRGSTITIPVAVHFPNGSEANRDCLVALAQDQVDILNADYSATNTDVVNWAVASPFYPGLQPGAANITFCLATSNHPVGVDPELLEGEPAVTIGYNFANGSGFPEQDANFVGYMNFLVKPIGGLGYSPGGGSIANGGAVVMNINAFGSGSGCPGFQPGAPYNLGRTVTHELGHFYGLAHTWGNDQNVSCASDDGFTDTPNTGEQTFGCPSPGSLNACVTGEKILSMNYMDYVNDACMYMFTPQQMNAVDAYIVSVIAPAIKPGVCEPAMPSFDITANDEEVFSCPETDTNATFSLSYSTILDFSETTVFTATGQPAGSTVSFSPASLNSPGDFTMTVGNLGATVSGVYTITVTGTSSSVTKSVDVTLSNNCVECNEFTNDTPVTISATGTPTVTSTVNIPSQDDVAILDVNVRVNINHTYVSDLILTLTSPNGTSVLLSETNGTAGADDYTNTVFDQEASSSITTGSAPYTGTFIPEGDLSTLYGEMSAGDWVLTVEDTFNQDGGAITEFTVEICADSSLSIDENTLEGFAIFPNPNKGEFTVKLNSNSGNDINIDVFDIRGRKIYNNSYANGSNFNQLVKLNNVQSGLYLVTITDGDKNVTRKIVVE
jgi:subtilisin-like proprotein convertase family protein